jgi:hypothetical protein
MNSFVKSGGGIRRILHDKAFLAGMKFAAWFAPGEMSRHDATAAISMPSARFRASRKPEARQLFLPRRLCLTDGI